jgi:hypothetical protein
MPIARQWLCKHVSSVKEADATVGGIVREETDNRRAVGGGVSYAVLPKAVNQGPKWNCSMSG